MKEFFKDYFFSFFVHRRAKNIYQRSFLITFINIIVLLISIFLSTFLSQEVSFKYHYDHADGLRESVMEVLPDDVVVKDEKLVVSTIYNSFSNDEKHCIEKGYYVIVDAREAKTTFDDFTLQMVKNSDECLSYEDYLLLPNEEKEAYTPLITRSGVYLDTIANIPKYEEYLSSKEEQTSFVEIKNKYINREISQLEYANTIYVLYGKSYYPEDVYTCDSYGGLPTMRSYYLSLLNTEGPELDYIFLYQEGVECCFYSKGKHIAFYGDYAKMKEVDLSLNKANKIDSFIEKTYRNTSSLRSVAYLFTTFFTWFVFVVAFIICVFIVRFILSLVYKNERHFAIKIMNLMGSFILVSSLIIGVVGVAMGFLLTYQVIIIGVPLAILLTVLVRTAIYYSIEKHPSDYIAEE